MKIQDMLLRRSWSAPFFIGLFALMAMSVAVGWDAWRDIFNIAYNDEEASHIFLVPIVALWLVWARRWRIRRIEPECSLWGPAVIIAGGVIMMWGYEKGGMQAVQHFGAVTMVVGSILTMVGRRVLASFFPAFAVLLLLIPVPQTIRQSISMPLQTVTAVVTQNLLETFGVAVTRSGNVLSVNGNPITIAEACNGLRMVFMLVLVSYLFAFSSPLRNWVRLVIVALSPVSAIVCNIIRLIPTVWAFGYLNRETADLYFHQLGGWVMPFVGFILLWVVIKALRWALVPVARYTVAYL